MDRTPTTTSHVAATILAIILTVTASTVARPFNLVTPATSRTAATERI